MAVCRFMLYGFYPPNSVLESVYDLPKIITFALFCAIGGVTVCALETSVDSYVCDSYRFFAWWRRRSSLSGSSHEPSAIEQPPTEATPEDSTTTVTPQTESLSNVIGPVVVGRITFQENSCLGDSLKMIQKHRDFRRWKALPARIRRRTTPLQVKEFKLRNTLVWPKCLLDDSGYIEPAYVGVPFRELSIPHLLVGSVPVLLPADLIPANNIPDRCLLGCDTPESASYCDEESSKGILESRRSCRTAASSSTEPSNRMRSLVADSHFTETPQIEYRLAKLGFWRYILANESCSRDCAFVRHFNRNKTRDSAKRQNFNREDLFSLFSDDKPEAEVSEKNCWSAEKERLWVAECGTINSIEDSCLESVSWSDKFGESESFLNGEEAGSNLDESSSSYSKSVRPCCCPNEASSQEDESEKAGQLLRVGNISPETTELMASCILEMIVDVISKEVADLKERAFIAARSVEESTSELEALRVDLSVMLNSDSTLSQHRSELNDPEIESQSVDEDVDNDGAKVRSDEAPRNDSVSERRRSVVAIPRSVILERELQLENLRSVNLESELPVETRPITGVGDESSGAEQERGSEDIDGDVIVWWTGLRGPIGRSLICASLLLAASVLFVFTVGFLAYANGKGVLNSSIRSELDSHWPVFLQRSLPGAMASLRETDLAGLVNIRRSSLSEMIWKEGLEEEELVNIHGLNFRPVFHLDSGRSLRSWVEFLARWPFEVGVQLHRLRVPIPEPKLGKVDLDLSNLESLMSATEFPLDGGVTKKRSNISLIHMFPWSLPDWEAERFPNIVVDLGDSGQSCGRRRSVTQKNETQIKMWLSKGMSVVRGPHRVNENGEYLWNMRSEAPLRQVREVLKSKKRAISGLSSLFGGGDMVALDNVWILGAGLMRLDYLGNKIFAKDLPYMILGRLVPYVEKWGPFFVKMSLKYEIRGVIAPLPVPNILDWKWMGLCWMVGMNWFSMIGLRIIKIGLITWLVIFISSDRIYDFGVAVSGRLPKKFVKLCTLVIEFYHFATSFSDTWTLISVRVFCKLIVTLCLGRFLMRIAGQSVWFNIPSVLSANHFDYNILVINIAAHLLGTSFCFMVALIALRTLNVMKVENAESVVFYNNYSLSFFVFNYAILESNSNIRKLMLNPSIEQDIDSPLQASLARISDEFFQNATWTEICEGLIFFLVVQLAVALGSVYSTGFLIKMLYPPLLPLRPFPLLDTFQGMRRPWGSMMFRWLSVCPDLLTRQESWNSSPDLGIFLSHSSVLLAGLWMYTKFTQVLNSPPRFSGVTAVVVWTLSITGFQKFLRPELLDGNNNHESASRLQARLEDDCWNEWSSESSDSSESSVDTTDSSSLGNYCSEETCSFVRRTIRNIAPGWFAREITVSITHNLARLFLAGDSLVGIDVVKDGRIVSYRCPGFNESEYVAAGVFVAAHAVTSSEDSVRNDLMFRVYMRSSDLPRGILTHVRFASSKVFVISDRAQLSPNDEVYAIPHTQDEDDSLAAPPLHLERSFDVQLDPNTITDEILAPIDPLSVSVKEEPWNQLPNQVDLPFKARGFFMTREQGLDVNDQQLTGYCFRYITIYAPKTLTKPKVLSWNLSTDPVTGNQVGSPILAGILLSISMVLAITIFIITTVLFGRHTISIIAALAYSKTPFGPLEALLNVRTFDILAQPKLVSFADFYQNNTQDVLQSSFQSINANIFNAKLPTAKIPDFVTFCVGLTTISVLAKIFKVAANLKKNSKICSQWLRTHTSNLSAREITIRISRLVTFALAAVFIFLGIPVLNGMWIDLFILRPNLNHVRWTQPITFLQWGLLGLIPFSIWLAALVECSFAFWIKPLLVVGQSAINTEHLQDVSTNTETANFFSGRRHDLEQYSVVRFANHSN